MTWASLKASTKGLLATLVTLSGLFQIKEVHDGLVAAVAQHPHLASAVGAVTGIAFLLHNPQVQAVLGVKRTVEVKEEKVMVADDAATPEKES